jgi:hypothetical protein
MDGVLVFPFCFSFVSMNNVELVIWMDGTMCWMNNVKLFVICMDGTMCWLCMYDQTCVLDMSYVCCEIAL